MNQAQYNAFDKVFLDIYKGNVEATSLSHAILQCLHTWDDLIDRDVVTSDEAINAAFLNALVTIGGSPLWTPDMGAHMLNVYLKWQDANYIEKNFKHDDNELSKAWMLRASCYDLFVLLATKLYGVTWGIQIGPSVRMLYGETLTSFIQEVKNA